MRIISFAALCVLPLAVSLAHAIDFDEFGQPFSLPKSVTLEWRAATNSLPSKVTLYKIVPNTFSPAVVSNVMALGQWTMNQRTKPSWRRPMPGDTDLLSFENTNSIEHLRVYAPVGLVDYRNEHARAAMGAQISSVPNDEEALRLGRELLKKLQIDERDLTKNTNGTLKYYGGRRVRGQRGVEQVISRDISFVRQVDGIAFNGIGPYGGVQVSFGNFGKVAELRVIWPKLQATESVHVAAPKELIDFVKHGGAVMEISEASEQILAHLSDLKRLTITEVLPVYFGTRMDENELKLGKLITPFANLTARMEFLTTNYSVVLSCPLVSKK